MSELSKIKEETRKLSEKIYLIGITGTDGKTTTTSLISHILNENGFINSCINSNSSRVGLSHFTPEFNPEKNIELNQALNNRKFFSDTLKQGIKIAVIETTAYALKIGYLEQAEFNLAIFTNLTHEHLDQYSGGFEEYFQTKLKLFKSIKPGSKNDLKNGVIVNLDDPITPRILQQLNPEIEKVIFYGSGKKIASKNYSSYTFDNYQQKEKSSNFICKNNQGESLELETKLLGRFNAYNILAAISCCQLIGLKKEHIEKSISSFQPPEGRFEILAVENQEDHPKVIVDYAHTPNGLLNTLILVKELQREKIEKGKIILIFSCHGERYREKRPIMGRIAESLADIIIITTQDLITEKPEQIINDILNGITKENISLAIEPDRRKAIFLGINIAKPEDIVLITGRGNDLLDINQQKIDAFYDKDIALMALKNYQKK